MRIAYPGLPQGLGPIVPNTSVPGQPTPQLPTPSVQPPQTLPVSSRQYPNIDRKWFPEGPTGDAAHAGIGLTIRQLWDSAYDAQNAVQIQSTSNPGVQLYRQPIGASGAVNPSQRANYLINATSKAVMTLGAPRPTLDDGTILDFTSTTNFGHEITTPGILLTGTASVNTATWPSFGGGSLVLEAQAGQWLVKSSNGVSFS
jgi:hypothetical protein